MPKRRDLHKILIIGAGPIIIGQGCEFDYSGTQACKALKEEGYSVVLINSNPATIMTDPETADRIYIEPVTPEIVAKIIEKERPDAILPTLGGQTGLNVAVKVAEMGILERFGVEMIGADYAAIKKAEDRKQFKEAMEKIGLDVPRSGLAYTMEDAWKVAEELGFPLVIRPSFTLGGTGGGIAFNKEEFVGFSQSGIEASMIGEILIEESVLGWKEYELEVMRDVKDNVVIICSIENLDPMGVHTGDSITVAPAQTLTDKEYQKMRDAAIAVIREIGVQTGGSNVQFAINPEDGRMVVIEINPRVSRSSALASKATGFPIAKIAAKLAVGYTLDEIPNDITKKTPASFEPTIDYCVIKIPRFTFEKFAQATDVLTTSMKSVGEAMAIGRTFKEALQKGLRSLEIGRAGLGGDGKDRIQNTEYRIQNTEERIKEKLVVPNSERIFYIREAIKMGMGIEEIYQLTKIDRWFLENIRQIVEMEEEIRGQGSGVRGQVSGERIQNPEFRIQNTEYRRQESGGRIQNTEFRIQNTEDRSQEEEFRIQKTEDRIQNSEFRIQNTEDRTLNLEHRTLNLEHRTLNIEHRTLNLEHRTLTLEPITLTLEPGTLNLEPGTLNLEPITLTLDPRTPIPDPRTPNPDPRTPNPESQVNYCERLSNMGLAIGSWRIC